MRTHTALRGEIRLAKPTVDEVSRANINAQLLCQGFSFFTCLMFLMNVMEAIRLLPWLQVLHADHWQVPFVTVTMYCAFLAMYVSNKEVMRWSHTKRITRRGGRWVIAWWTMFFLISLGSMIFETVKIPRHLAEQCFVVLVLFMGSETMKKFYIRKYLGAKPSTEA
ncbi:MAG: hypothetical protein WC497_01585 [Patescibacteria group bacterium]